jgi:diphosphomevalonate decarboxylase
MSSAVRAVAHPNIALVKYWGKAPGDGNLPAVPSLSLTLDGMRTTTTVRFDQALPADRIRLGGRQGGGAEHPRIARLLDRVRAAAGIGTRAEVTTENDFPTASGLASSASGFAALALAASRAAGLTLSPAEVSDLARRSSASAARSVFGGFVTLAAGAAGAPRLSAEPLLSAGAWDVALTVAVTSDAEKPIGSTEAMARTAATSPYYRAWVEAAPELFARARKAVLERDLERLGLVMEKSALAMHACAMAAEPAIIYWNAATITVLERVRRLRAEGTLAFATMDAGPHVKVLSSTDVAPSVRRALLETGVVLRVIETRPGPGARVEDA